jgi:hypothetical protein
MTIDRGAKRYARPRSRATCATCRDLPRTAAVHRALRLVALTVAGHSMPQRKRSSPSVRQSMRHGSLSARVLARTASTAVSFALAKTCDRVVPALARRSAIAWHQCSHGDSVPYGAARDRSRVKVRRRRERSGAVLLRAGKGHIRIRFRYNRRLAFELLRIRLGNDHDFNHAPVANSSGHGYTHFNEADCVAEDAPGTAFARRRWRPRKAQAGATVLESPANAHHHAVVSRARAVVDATQAESSGCGRAHCANGREVPGRHLQVRHSSGPYPFAGTRTPSRRPSGIPSRLGRSNRAADHRGQAGSAV